LLVIVGPSNEVIGDALSKGRAHFLATGNNEGPVRRAFLFQAMPHLP